MFTPLSLRLFFHQQKAYEYGVLSSHAWTVDASWQTLVQTKQISLSLSLSLSLQLSVYHGWSFVQIVVRTSHKTDCEIQLLPHFAPLKCTMLIMVSSSDETAVWILKVGPIPIDDGLGKEVVTKLTTNLTSNNEFYTDSNGRDFLKRVKRKQSPLLSLIELWA